MTMFLLIPLVIGCDNETGTDLPADAPVPVRIAGVSIGAQIQTRATTTTIIGGNIGVFRVATNGYSAQYNSKYTYSGGWKSDNAINVGGADATLCAYYPYGAVNFTNSTICTITAQNYTSDRDLCYATTGGANVCNKTPNVNFAMKRGYARLKLSVTRGNYVGNCRITNVKIKSGTAFCTSRTLDISNGTYGGSTTSGEWTYNPNLSIQGDATNTACDVLVPPQSVSDGLTITLTIDGVDRAVTIPAASFGSSLFDGQLYTIGLRITDTTITLTGSIGITDMETNNTVITNNTPTEV